MRRPPTARHERRLPVILVAGLTAFLLLGCSSAAGNSSPTLAPTPSASAAQPTDEVTPVPTDPTATPVSQTDTPWGRIWDGLPADFPAYPGAQSTETGAGPASATLDAAGADPATVVGFYKKALESAGWITTGSTGPMEDGSRVLSNVNIHPACQLQTTVTPLGGSTIITILFGAGCPFSN